MVSFESLGIVSYVSSIVTANAILGKVGGRAPKDVIFELIRSKCLPALLYGLDFGSVSSAKIRYQFVRFCWKSLFREIVSDK